MRNFERSWIFVFVMFFAMFSFLQACPDYYAPTAVVDIESYAQGAREVQVHIGTTLAFLGEGSYDNDEDGDSITYYEWYVWESGSSMPSLPTYSSYNLKYTISGYNLFGTAGTYYVRLVVTDNGIANPAAGEEPQQFSMLENTGLNTCVIVVVDPADCPVVENVDIENVTAISADIFGELISVGSGGGTCTIKSYWGTTEGGEHPAGWQNSQVYSTSQGVGDFSDTISQASDFEPGKLYYFRFYAKNNTDGIEDWADIEAPNCYRFVTVPGEARLEADDPVAAWAFDENGGDTVYDAVGNNNGTLVGPPSWTTGIIGSALEFDGVADSIYFNNILSNEISSAFTIDAWFKLNPSALLSGKINTLFHKYDDRPGMSINGQGSDAVARLKHWYNHNNGVAAFGTGAITSEKWYNLVYTYDGTVFKGYINGVNVGSLQDSGYSPGTSLRIGSDTDVASRCFDGVIDDVRIYSRALTRNEIATSYHNKKTNKLSVLPTLQWIPGESDFPVLHDVYFGTDETAVSNATPMSTEYKGRFNTPVYRPGLLEAHTAYYWRVDEVVLDPFNNGEERLTMASVVWSFTTGIASPVNLKAFAGNGMAYLSWSIGDTTDVQGYNLYRATDGTAYTKVNTSLIIDLGYKDTGLANGTTYHYVVAAEDSMEKESARSEEVSVTPQATIGNVAFVDDDASGSGTIQNPYSTINAAIDAASSGDEIIVQPGTYAENVNYDDKILRIRSIDPDDWDIVDSTIIQGDGSTYTVSINADQGSGTELKGFTVTNGDANIGIRVFGDTASPIIENCIIENCTAGILVINADIMYISKCKIRNNTTGITGIAGGRPIVTSSLIYQNDAGIRSIFNPLAEVYNCTIVDNSVLGVLGVPVISNCIVWDNETDLDNCAATYSCISSGDAGLGNIIEDPLFVDTTDYRLSIFSPCIDAGDNDVWDGISGIDDIDGQGRKLRGWYVDDTGNGDAPIVDMGADEWSPELNESEIPYLTSFEESSGFETGDGYYGTLTMNSEDSSIDGWTVEDGSVYIRKAQYEPLFEDPDDTNDYMYQYVNIGNGDIISRSFDSNHPAEIIRISCIPGENAQINILSGVSEIISLQFNSDGYIYLGDGINDPISTGEIYDSVASVCRTYIGYKDGSFNEWNPRPGMYSYENTWIKFEIHIDWNSQTYTVLWRHMDVPGGEIIATDISFENRQHGFDEIEFSVDGYGEDGFYINRISVSNEAESGGVWDDDIWIELPIADMDHPLKGHVPVIGDMWYDQLGKYVIKACPVAEYSDPPKTITINAGDSNEEEVEVDPWMVVVENGCTKLNANLGYWMTQTLQNGDYYLKLEVYDDLGCLIAEEIMSEELQYYQGIKTVFTEYPVIGRAKGSTYHYEEISDVTVNWPGSFPFEFKRTYNHALRKQIAPLFFGWTHNHNIKLTENCSTQWAIDSGGAPLADENDLGIGRIWLQRGLGCQMYMGQVDPTDSTKVIYRPCDQYERDYIVRTTSAINTMSGQNSFDVEYVHYNPADGMTLTFEKDDVPLNYILPAGIDEGVVDWMTSLGINRQEDRFGNALIYTWHADLTSQMDMYITEIKNNRTPARLVFENELKLFDNPDTSEIEGPCLYSQLNVVDSGNSTYIAMKYEGDINSQFASYYYRKADAHSLSGRRGGADQSQTSMSYGVDFDSFSIDLRSFRPALYYYCPDPENSDSDWWFKHYSDGTIKEIRKYSFNYGAGSTTQFCSTEKYVYAYTSDGDLETTTEFWPESYTNTDTTDIKDLIKVEKKTSNPEGQLIRHSTTSYQNQSPGYYNQVFDPYQYWDVYDDRFVSSVDTVYEYLYNYSWHVGGGGNLETEYAYEDTRFPLKPTKITEYFDDDGDMVYDRSKKTELQYNERSNTSLQKVYVDSNNYILTEYEYHDIYDFQICQRTWQDYCYDDTSGNPIKPEIGRIEKQWSYGLYDGTASNDPKLNIYLVEQSQLLDDRDPSITTDDEFSVTSYEYDVFVNVNDFEAYGGQLKIKEVQVDDDSSNDQVDISVDYYLYDDNGFLSKEWNGVPVDASGDIVLNVDGYPLKPGTTEIINPQKRYLNNDRGLRLLEADYLGKVRMNLYDTLVDDYPEVIYENCGRIAQTRTYIDPDAVDLDTDFVVSRYDDDLEHDPDSTPADDDTWETRTIYEDYTYYGKPRNITLPTGGTIEQGFFRDSDSKHFVEYPESSGDSRCFWGYDHDGKLLEMFQTRSDGYNLCKLFAYNSLGRPVHTYEYAYAQRYYFNPQYFEYPSVLFPNPYLTHTEFGYLASGEKVSEKSWKIKKTGFESDDGFEASVLEKCVGYKYDSLGRMIAQATWIVSDTINPYDMVPVPDESSSDCMVVQYGYDAAGNRVYVIDSNSNVIFTDYDNANRKIAEYFAVEPPDDGSGDPDITAAYANAVPKTTVEYYLNGKAKQKSSYDYDGILLACSQFVYDARGRVEEVKQVIGADPDGLPDTNPSDNEIMLGSTLYDVAVTGYTYSDDGQATGPLRNGGTFGTDDKYHIVITDAENKQTGIYLSYHGKPEIATYPSGDYEEYVYYDYPLDDSLDRYLSNGLLEKKAVWDSGTKEYISYEYDEYGKMNTVTYPDNGGSLEYTYTDRILGKYGKVAAITDNRHSDDRPGGSGSTYSFTYYPWSESLMSYMDADDYLYEYDYNTAYNRKKSIEVTNPSEEIIYSAMYDYDLAGRLADVNDMYADQLAHFDYDDNGNRTGLTYHLDGTETGPTYGMTYTHTNDNFLESIDIVTNCANNADYSFDAIDIDGLGRLCKENVEMTHPTGDQVEHGNIFFYDMTSQLTQWAIISPVMIDNQLTGEYEIAQIRDFDYREDGNIFTKTIDTQGTDFEYDTTSGNGSVFDSDLMTSVTTGGATDNLTWDDNGQLTTGPAAATFVWNADGKLRSATKGSDSMAVKYDPMGNRVYKSSVVDGTTTTRKYIVDISGKLPTILCEIDTSDGSLKKSYIYANAQIVAQREHNPSDPAVYDEYFYVHDRLGSVRMVVEYNGTDAVNTVNSYTYTPFGDFYGTPVENVDNPWTFTGQWYDAEISQYYLRARQYDPTMMRFTGRDPVRGKQPEPLTLHKYLYCNNNSINMVDPDGRFAAYADMLMSSAIQSHLRKADYKFHMKLKDQMEGQLDSFSMMNLQRGVVYDMLVVDVDGGFKRSIRDGGIEGLGFFSENLGRIASLAAEGWDDKEEIRGILESESWGGLFDYSKDKLTDIFTDPGTYGL